MSDIFRDLAVKQNKTPLPLPPHYRKQPFVRDGRRIPEEHIGDIMIRVIVGICDRSTEYHRKILEAGNGPIQNQ